MYSLTGLAGRAFVATVLWAAWSLAPDCTARAADGLEFALPVDCELNQNCFIQQYVDVDPGPAARDYTCGAATYDGHKGTDFRVRTLADAKRGFAVLAAAEGVVRALRDGEDDRVVKNESDRRAIRGKECGNGVVVSHGDGWETQYCHMRRGSVAVKQGQSVAQGEPLGLIGYSGDAAFPHLHFQVRHRDRIVDPFDVSAISRGCDGAPGEDLWRGGLTKALTYQTAQILDLEFASGRVAMDALLSGTRAPFRPAPDAPALVVYVWSINLLKGDRFRLSISGPNGELVSREMAPLDGNKAQQMYFVGKRRPASGWPQGAYVGTVEVVRDGRTLRQATRTIEIR